jgi:hypothetical protein
MKRDERTRYLMRHRILKLLSKGELARVCTAESAVRIEDGDEYLNLEAIGLGVRSALGTDAAEGRLLSRKAVRQATWSKILRVLAEPGLAAAQPAVRHDPL